MERLFRGVLKHRGWVIAAFVVLTALCAWCIPQVAIDANMSDYLPESAKSSQDLDFMKSVYGNDIANACVYVTGISQHRRRELRRRSSRRRTTSSPSPGWATRWT
jgi:predicted RND superfamily exporter protein